MVRLKRGEGKGWEVDKNQAYPDSLLPKRVGVLRVVSAACRVSRYRCALCALTSRDTAVTSFIIIALVDHSKGRNVRTQAFRKRHRRIEQSRFCCDVAGVIETGQPVQRLSRISTFGVLQPVGSKHSQPRDERSICGLFNKSKEACIKCL
jgi:hypothetical protein